MSARWIHVHEMVSSIGPEKVSDDDLQKLENFAVLMYDRSSAASCVNEARLDHFAPCPQAEDLRCDSTNQSCLIEGAR